MRIDLSCPVENRGSIVKTNSETNEQYLLLKLLNISDKTITGVKFNVLVYNSTGEEVAVIPVELSDLEAEPKKFFAENKAISLTDIEDAKNFVVEVLRAEFPDEEPYVPSEEKTVTANSSEASVDEAMALRQFVPEAVCFSEENIDHWRCVCGRPNFLDMDTCVRCGRDKTEILSKFSSMDALERTVAEAKEAEEEANRLAEEEAAKEFAEKKAKQKKNLIRCGIAVGIVAVLAILFFVGRIVYYNIAANKAAESGDYSKAYEYYLKIGSDKANEVSEFARGNTPANLMFQGGLCTEDSENLYFLTLNNDTYHFNLIKENKKSGKKEILTDSAAGSLCSVGDYIYFMDVENSYVKRITKDGKTIDTILEVPVKHIDVIGNTLYYIRLDYDNPGNLSEEQCQTLAAQGQMASYDRIHKFDIDSKKDTLLAKESVLTCAIYGDKIYYLSANNNEDTWASSHLYSMSLNGKNVKEIVASPVATFLVKDNALYYVPLYNQAKQGQEIASVEDLDYRVMKMDLSTNEVSEMNTEYMTLYLNSSEDMLLSVVVNRAQYIAYYNAMFSGEDVEMTEPSYSIISTNLQTGVSKYLVTGDVQIFNVSGDDIICYLASQGICRLKTDGSGFEPVYADGTANPPEVVEETELSEDLQGLADDMEKSE